MTLTKGQFISRCCCGWSYIAFLLKPLKTHHSAAVNDELGDFDVLRCSASRGEACGSVAPVGTIDESRAPLWAKKHGQPGAADGSEGGRAGDAKRFQASGVSTTHRQHECIANASLNFLCSLNGKELRIFFMGSECICICYQHCAPCSLGLCSHHALKSSSRGGPPHLTEGQADLQPILRSRRGMRPANYVPCKRARMHDSRYRTKGSR